jgi:virulence factor
MVLNDPEIKGLLIAVPPHKHYDLVKKSLEKHKMVFVEKPPCRTSEELSDLIRLSENGSVLTGLQKRYAPACIILKKKLKNANHYTLHYRVGGYPEGDALLELFIHPVDLITYLFGKAELRSIIRTKETLFLHLQHENGTVGSVELSTAYSWQQAEERLTVMTNNNIYELNGLSELQLRSNPVRIAQIPVEKILSYTPRTELLFGAHTFIPSVQHNNLYINGFYSEIKAFIRMCETNDFKINLSSPASLKHTYSLLEEIGGRL